MHYRTTMVIGLVASLLIAIYPLRVGAAGDAQVVQQVSANGQRNLRPFTVKDKWEIQWDAKGPMLMIGIYDADGGAMKIAASQQGDGNGSSYQAKGGDYYLQVIGGEWTVTVIQLR